MWHNVRIWLKVVLGFLFSITVILTFISFSLFGVQAEDSVRVIVTEATGLERDVTVFTATLQPMVIHNVFWLCMAGLGFLLIFLYFIDHSFKVFFAPGVLTLAISVLVVIVLVMSLENIFALAGDYGEIYLDTAVFRFQQVVTGMVIFGALLIGLSYWGDKYFKKSHVS